MFRMLLLATIILTVLGCDYFDDSDEMSDSDNMLTLVVDSTPVVIPVDADWDLIATLERNPLKTNRVLYFSRTSRAAINTAYVEGKHFIFEIGKEPIETSTSIRYTTTSYSRSHPFRTRAKHPEFKKASFAMIRA